MSLLNKIKKVKNVVVDKVSDLMAFPAIMRANSITAKTERDLADLRLVREMKGVDSSNMDWRDPLFRARANVAILKFENEYAQKRAEANKKK